MILHKLSKKEFYLLAKNVLAELDEGQAYSDNAMTRNVYENVKAKYRLLDVEIEFLRIFRSWPFTLRCKDGELLRVTTPLIKNRYRYLYNENGECIGFAEGVTDKKNRKNLQEERKERVTPKSSLTIEEQVSVIKMLNNKHSKASKKK